MISRYISWLRFSSCARVSCSTSPSAITREAWASTPRAAMEPASTISSKARENRKSPTSTLDGAPQIRCAATLPRRNWLPSTTSSCSRVAVWMNSTAAASFRHASSLAPARRAEATVSSGRKRFPPAAIRWSAKAGITGTGLSMRSMISASTPAMSRAASSVNRSTEAAAGRAMAWAASKILRLLLAATNTLGARSQRADIRPSPSDNGCGIGQGQGEHKASFARSGPKPAWSRKLLKRTVFSARRSGLCRARRVIAPARTRLCWPPPATPATGRG